MSETPELLAALWNGNPDAIAYNDACGLLIKNAADLKNFPRAHVGIMDEISKAKDKLRTAGLIDEQREYVPVFSHLTSDQLKMLLPYLNKCCFYESQTLQQLIYIFQLKRTHTRVTSVRLLGYLLDGLRGRGLLADGWQTTAEEYQLFTTKSGKTLTQKYISRQLKETIGNGGLIDTYKRIRQDEALRVSMGWKRKKGERTFTKRMKKFLEAIVEADDLIKIL